MEAKDFIMRAGAMKRFERIQIGMALAHPFITRSKISPENMKDFKRTLLDLDDEVDEVDRLQIIKQRTSELRLVFKTAL